MKNNECLTNKHYNKDVIVNPISFMSEEDNHKILSVLSKEIRENNLKDRWIKFEDFVSKNREKYHL